ncbi:MAG: four helix bundle protein [Bacteroidales bacterium]|nr:four helix bundle protein [Bacteroidales bacterium]
MNDFRELIVWQKSIELVEKVYQVTNSFPKEEMFSLTSQIRRSAISIPSNIAEGFGRKTTPDYIRFLHIARGSLYELQTQLEISNRIKYLGENDLRSLIENCKEVEKMLNSLIKSLANKIK